MGNGLCVVRRACSAAGGCKSRPNLMEVKGSEAQSPYPSRMLVVNPAVAYRKLSNLSREIC